MKNKKFKVEFEIEGEMFNGGTLLTMFNIMHYVKRMFEGCNIKKIKIEDVKEK